MNVVDELSNEIWLMVLDLLPRKSLVQLMTLSSRLQSLCASVIYREVKSSLHQHKIPDGNSSADFSWVLDLDREKVDQHRQHLLGLLLNRRRTYAANVRSFTWTMGFHRPEMGKRQQHEHLFPQLQLFDLLGNVTRLDLDTGFARLPPMADAHSLSLFPRASHVRLGGVMPYAFASAILHGKDKEPLTTLTLFNMIEPGRLRNGSVYRYIAEGTNERSIHLHPQDIVEIWPADSNPIQVRPGCMRRLLTPELQARCGRLDRLILRKQGQQYSEQELPSDMTYENDVYKEWADFILATQPRHLRLEHGGATTFPLNGRTPKWYGETSTLIREDMGPMDLRFQKYISPILSNGWPRLRSLSIQGVCSQIAQPIIDSLKVYMPHVEVELNETVEWCWNGTVADPQWPANAFIRPVSSNMANGDAYMHSQFVELKREASKPDLRPKDIYSDGGYGAQCGWVPLHGVRNARNASNVNSAVGSMGSGLHRPSAPRMPPMA